MEIPHSAWLELRGYGQRGLHGSFQEAGTGWQWVEPEIDPDELARFRAANDG